MEYTHKENKTQALLFKLMNETKIEGHKFKHIYYLSLTGKKH